MKTTTLLTLTSAVLVGSVLTAARGADMPLPTCKHLSSKNGDPPHNWHCTRSILE